MSLPPPISPVRAWIMAARPRTLPAAASPVLVALALAAHNGAFHFPSALACLLVSLLMQVGANFANDLFDHQRGSDTGERLGPTRVSSSGLLSTRHMQAGMLIVFGLAAGIGASLALRAGSSVILLGLVLILAALAYSGGPFPYGYFGMGDVFVFLSFGLVAVCGTYYVQALTIPPLAVWDAVPVGLLIVNILVVNNTRDIATDRAAHKRTLAVLFGRQGMLVEYLACLVGAYLVPVAVWVAGLASWGGLLAWLSLPEAIGLFIEFSRSDGRSLNQTLARTARLAFLFAVLYSLGILLIP